MYSRILWMNYLVLYIFGKGPGRPGPCNDIDYSMNLSLPMRFAIFIDTRDI